MFIILLLVAGALVFTIWLTNWVLSKAEGPQAMRDVAAAIREGAEGFLATQYSAILMYALTSCVLLFLLYPGSSTKIFNALLCVGFNGEGESGQTFLRVDFSIDCASPLYQGFVLPYALVAVMLATVPLGRQVMLGLQHADLLGQLEALGQRMQQDRIHIVDAGVQALEFGEGVHFFFPPPMPGGRPLPPRPGSWPPPMPPGSAAP